MYVIKRDGRQESVKFDKITARIKKLCYGLSSQVSAEMIAMKVIEGIYDGVTTTELDNLAARVAAASTLLHPDYALLASRLAISNLHKNTCNSFSDLVHQLYHYIDSKTGTKSELISKPLYELVMQNSDLLNNTLVYDRDFRYDYFGFKTLERSYLIRVEGKIAERPQHMLMRVALGIYGKNLKAAIESYHLMSEGWFTHASPTLFNAGTQKAQMSSSFLLSIKEDSIPGIFETLKQCAMISQSSGGMGINISNIRAEGTYIKGSNGKSNGIVPMLKVFNDTAQYVEQGGGKRKGSMAMYLEPWHADVYSFLNLKKTTGEQSERAPHLNYALWIPDLFMKRIEDNTKWTLMCPQECPGLSDSYGEDFEVLYKKYEKEGRGRKTVRAQELWLQILESEIETGMPYLLFKDAINHKSNQKNLGVITCSNLTTEITAFSNTSEIAVCNLASIALPKFVKDGEFDHQKLFEITYHVTKNLDAIIDNNFYSFHETGESSQKHRPIGIGVQGLADTFILMRYPFESNEAARLNREIFETIYYAALTASTDLAKTKGVFSTFHGSPISRGELQFHMWNISPSQRWDWEYLIQEIKEHGVRNSLLVASMPTTSTAKILGNNECTEPFNTLLNTMQESTGTFYVINKHLLKDLVKLGIWNDSMKNKIIENQGSIQNIDEIPDNIKMIYKTAWEISSFCLVDMAAQRAPFICQSQAMNLFIENPDPAKLTAIHFYSWKKGLKTGMYQLHTKTNSTTSDINNEFHSEQNISSKDPVNDRISSISITTEAKKPETDLSTIIQNVSANIIEN